MRRAARCPSPLGNGIDPIDVIDAKGADALRFFLSTNSAPGLDTRFDEAKIDKAWNFINKIWNASRYVQMQMDGKPAADPDFKKLSEADQWILARLNETIDNVERNLDRYEMGLAGNALYNFVWNDFCSWYIELSKAALNSENPQTRENTVAILVYVLRAILILLSPDDAVCDRSHLSGTRTWQGQHQRRILAQKSRILLR